MPVSIKGIKLKTEFMTFLCFVNIQKRPFYNLEPLVLIWNSKFSIIQVSFAIKKLHFSILDLLQFCNFFLELVYGHTVQE